jgi:CBS domain containing-hemolysin-like protein
MNPIDLPARSAGMPWRGIAALVALAACVPAHASMFSGETLDAVANGVAWVALIVGPIVAIVVFWLVHILPEKIAEDRKHPQAKAIQTLCILSLFFGGLLWPLAWLWAYSKPVLYRMAYGTDVAEDHHGKETPAAKPPATAGGGGRAEGARRGAGAPARRACRPAAPARRPRRRARGGLTWNSCSC